MFPLFLNSYIRIYIYICSLLVDPSDFSSAPDDMGRGLSGSRHGLGGSRHGRGRSLGFRAKSGKGGMETMTSSLASSGVGSEQSEERKTRVNGQHC